MNEATEDLLKRLRDERKRREHVASGAAFDRDPEIYAFNSDMVEALGKCIDAITIE